MTYKTILANIQDIDRYPELINFATSLAANHDAHLIGLHVMPTAYTYAIYAPAPVTIVTEVIEAQRKHFANTAKTIEDAFVAAAQTANIRYEWRCVESNEPSLGATVVKHAQSADISVTGQPDPNSRWETWADIPEQLLLESGRPVLVLPYAGKHDAQAKHVMVAWNRTKESARATFDAMPFLKAADLVRVLSVDIGESGGADGFTPGDEVAANLSRHGVKTETASSITGDISIGNELLSRAADCGSGLLVMGGYGHGTIYESLLGGATRHILKHMTMPVLMAH